MQPTKILEQIETLPPQAQQEVADFVAFLHTRYTLSTSKLAKKPKGSLRDEPFVGMWKDREDMKDSVAWVRKIRKEQWRIK